MLFRSLFGAQSSALFANKASPAVLNRITGVVLTVLGAAMLVIRFFL